MSPYLERPVRSIEQVRRDREKLNQRVINSMRLSKGAPRWGHELFDAPKLRLVVDNTA